MGFLEKDIAATAEAQHVQDVLDPGYSPLTSKVALFKEQQKYPTFK